MPFTPVQGMGDELIQLVLEFQKERDLIKRAKIGDEIFRRIGPEIHLFARATVPESSAADVAQETLMGIARNLHRFAGTTTGQLWAWCLRIARNKASNFYRSRPHEEEFDESSPEELREIAEASGAAKPLSAGDRLDLEAAMTLLELSKPLCREFLLMHFIFGLSYAELAEEYESTYDAVRVRIDRCLEHAQELVGTER